MALIRDNEECQEFIEVIRELGEEGVIIALSSMVHELVSPSPKDLRNEAAILLTMMASVLPEVWGLDMEELLENYDEKAGEFLDKDEDEFADIYGALVKHYLEDKAEE